MAKKLAMIFGVVFVLVGILGFISNPIVGAEGIFKTNLLHDIVHIALGVVLIVAGSMSLSASSMTMKVVALVYLLVAVLGFFLVKDGSLFGLVTLNMADNYLHVALAVVLFGASTMKDSSSMMGSGPSQTPPMQS